MKHRTQQFLRNFTLHKRVPINDALEKLQQRIGSEHKDENLVDL